MIIKEQAKFHEADSAAAIVLSPNGEILALANYPSTNPNNHQSYSADDYRNRVFSDKTEPGSTMKPFTMLLALDKGVITATDDELIDVKNRVGNIPPDKKYFEMTIQQILEKSHNLGTVMVAENIENEDFYNTWDTEGKWSTVYDSSWLVNGCSSGYNIIQRARGGYNEKERSRNIYIALSLNGSNLASALTEYYMFTLRWDEEGNLPSSMFYIDK